jgi:DNA-directed RNA polymerase sigma subunit (sigma70/sigma32)
MFDKAALKELTQEQEKLFNENLKWVDLLKSKYYFMGDDAESIAYEQLLKAIRSFDSSKGVPLKNLFFIYYQNAMKNAVLQEARRVGRSTVDEKVLMDELKKLENTLDVVTEGDSKEELEDEIIDIKNKLKQLKEKTNLSLDMPMGGGEEDAVQLYELLEDAQAAAPTISEYKHLKERLQSKLSPVEFQILESVEKGYTLSQISDMLKGTSAGKKYSRPQQIQYILDHKIRPLVQQETFK